jgi:hypothetical protein
VHLFKQQGFRKLCGLQHFDANTAQVLVLTMKLEFTNGAALGFKPPQAVKPHVIAITQRAETS